MTNTKRQNGMGGNLVRRTRWVMALAGLASAMWSAAQSMGNAQGPNDSLVDGFRNVEVASVSDAMEQLYGQRAYMSHEMRPLSRAKFAGPAVTVLLEKEEHKDGASASQGMLDVIDAAAAGSVYMMVLEDAPIMQASGASWQQR